MTVIKVGTREIMLCEWNGHYRIEVGRMGHDREGNPRWWADRVREYVWNKETKTRGMAEKDSNKAVPLGGTIEEAERVLLTLLRDLTNKEYYPEEPVPAAKPEEDSVPF